MTSQKSFKGFEFLSAADLARLKEISSKATAGPYGCEEYVCTVTSLVDQHPDLDSDEYDIDDNERFPEICTTDCYDNGLGETQNERNAEFITAACNAVPLLIAEVENSRNDSRTVCGFCGVNIARCDEHTITFNRDAWERCEIRPKR